MILPGEDIVGHGSNVIFITEGEAESSHEGSLARSDGSIILSISIHNEGVDR